MKNLQFSVLLSVYHKEIPSYLEAALFSIWDSQLLKPSQIVLVKDGLLTPELELIVGRWKSRLGDTLCVVPIANNVGLASALNMGLQFCEYDLVARMDTDDIAKPIRFQRQVNFMSENPWVSASSSFIEEFDGSGKIISIRKLPFSSEAVSSFAKQRSPLSHPAVIFKKSAVLEVGGYPEIYPEDYLLWVKMIMNGCKLANIPEVLLSMRTDRSFITRRGYEFLKGEIKIYQYMRSKGFISYFEYYKIILIRSVLRLSPDFFKVLLYKLAR